MKLKKEQIAAVLRDMANLVEAGDSFEGRIEYTCMDDDLGPGEFQTTAYYRTGNSLGQGGVSLIQ